MRALSTVTYNGVTYRHGERVEDMPLALARTMPWAIAIEPGDEEPGDEDRAEDGEALPDDVDEDDEMPILDPPRDDQGLRTDGPTFEEWIAAGYTGDAYPPAGYAETPTEGLSAYRASVAAGQAALAAEQALDATIAAVNTAATLDALAALEEAEHDREDGPRLDVLAAVNARIDAWEESGDDESEHATE